MKFATKQISKRVLSCVLALAVMLCTVSSVFTVFAETTEPYSVTYGSPAIPMFVDKMLNLSNIKVQFTNDGDFVTGDTITWDYADGTDTAAVSLTSGKIVAEKAGVHALTATYDGVTKNIYVVVNEAGNYDFYLVKENFAGGIDVSEWDFYRISASNGRFAKLDVGEDGYINDPAFTADDWQNQVFSMSGSNLRIGMDCVYWQDTMYMVYKSDVLKDFADYTVTTKLVDQGNTYKWSASGFVVRADIGSSAEESQALQMFYRSCFGFNFMSLGGNISSYGYHSSENGFTAIAQDTYDTTITVSGSDMKYSMAKNGTEVFNFDSTKAMYQYNSDTATNTEYTTYANDFANKGTINPGTVGFANINLAVVVDSLSVKLNGISSDDDLPILESKPKIYTVGAANPVIPMTAGTRVSLADFIVQIGTDSYSAADLTYDTDGISGISVADGYLSAYDRGVYSVVASIDGSSTTIHIVVKSPDETEYVVFEKDYRSETTDVSEWKTTVITDDSTEYTGKTYSGNYIDNNNFQYNWNSINDHPKGFVPYNGEELENALSDTDIAVYTTLDNDVVASLSNYTVTAGIKAYPSYRGAVGVIGRAVTNDGKYTIGSGAGFALENGAAENYIYSARFPKNGAFSISGNARTKVSDAAVLDYMYNTVGAQRFMHRTFEISYSGDSATLTTPNGGTEVLSGVNTQAGTVGIVSYFKDNNADYPYASVPVLSDIKIVLNNVDLSGLPSEDIPDHTATGTVSKTSPYVDNGNYTFTVDENNMMTAYNIVDSSIGYSEKVTISGDIESFGSVFRDSPKNTTLGEVVISEGVKNIWDQAFYNNYFLDTVTFPTSLVSVGPNAFQNSGVTDVVFPSGSKLTKINSYAFANCYSLRNLALPDGLETIGANAFQNVVSLTSVKIPASVTSIGDNAFVGCTILKDVYFFNSQTVIGATAIPKTATIYGYTGSTAEAYATANGNTFVAIDNISGNAIASNSAFNIGASSFMIGEELVLGSDIAWTAHRDTDYEISNGWLLVYGEEDFTITGTYNNEEVSVYVKVAAKGTATELQVKTIADEHTTIAPVSGDTTAYTVTINETDEVALKYGTLTVTADNCEPEKITVATDDTGKVFGFNVIKPETMELQAEYTTLANRESSIYPLGVQIRPETDTYTAGIRFVSRFPEIKENAQGIYLNEAYTQAGILVIPEVLFGGMQDLPTANSLVISDEDEDGTTEVSIGSYSAQNVLVKNLLTANMSYSDAAALLIDIPETMKSVNIIAIPYLIGADGSVTYVDGELTAQSYNDIYLLTSYPEYDGDVDVLFYGGTDHDIDGIDSTSSLSYKTGEDISFILNLKTAYKLSWQLDKDDPDVNTIDGETYTEGSTVVKSGTFDPATEGSIFSLTTQMANAGVVRLTVNFLATNGTVVATVYMSAAADYENITQSLEEGFTAKELVAETSAYYNSWTTAWDAHIADVNDAIDSDTGLAAWLNGTRAVGDEYTIDGVLKLKVATVESNYVSYLYWIATDDSIGIATNGDSFLTRPATGVFAVPTGATANSLNLRAEFAAYGVSSVSQRGPTSGTVTVRVTNHGMDNGSEFDGASHINMIGDNPETVYQYGVLRRDYTVMQVAKHIFADILKDGEEFAITTEGGSMAGWQAVVMAALDEEVNSIETAVTWMCQLGANQYGDIISWHPDAYVATTSKAARVFSTVTAAHIINERVVNGDKAFTLSITTAGLGDYSASAPHGVIALYNAFDGENANITKSANFYQFREHGKQVYGTYTKFVSSLSNN